MKITEAEFDRYEEMIKEYKKSIYNIESAQISDEEKSNISRNLYEKLKENVPVLETVRIKIGKYVDNDDYFIIDGVKYEL